MSNGRKNLNTLKEQPKKMYQVMFHTKYPENFRACLRSAQFFKVRTP
jgi:hypothetical protein